ncbi:MAG: hypothetical protein R2728_03980 [Chitinophagales bacterium]
MLHKYVTFPIVLVATAYAAPSLPEHVTGVEVVNKLQLVLQSKVTSTLAVVVQPDASVAITVVVPALKPIIVGVRLPYSINKLHFR